MSEHIHDSVLDLVGATPLVRLPRLNDTGADILAKLEFANPMGQREGSDRSGHDRGRRTRRPTEAGAR